MQNLREAFGERARMVTVDQGGHLAYLFKDNECANDLATEFLVRGTRHDFAC
ncbi:alpha/beta hydrolase [Amycolatopsis japonica]